MINATITLGCYISHFFKFFLVPGKIFNTISKPVMHTKPAPQPIMNGCSSPNRPIKPPTIIVIAPIGPIIPIITVALRTISDSGKFDIFLPAMNEERAIPLIPMPIPLLSASFFLPTIIFLLAPISNLPLLPSLPRSSVSYNDT